MMINRECIQFTQGPRVPCRGIEGQPNQFFPDKFGRCPFTQCMALKVLSDNELLKRIIPIKDQEEAKEENKEWVIRMLVFHAICPGDHNTFADENIINNYSGTDSLFANNTRD